VLIGGTYEEPQAHSVLAIHSISHTKDEFVKEVVLDGIVNRRKGKEYAKDFFRNVQNSIGKEFVRFYLQEDFSYIRWRDKTWKRAEIPSNFKDYGYTKHFQERGRNNAETERGVSDSVNKSDTQFQMREHI
jgi:hypothetical protein